MIRGYWAFQTGRFAPGSTRNDRGTSRPCLFPPMAVKSKPPAVRMVVDSKLRVNASNEIFLFVWRLFILSPKT
jgi:hypothetical protein